MQLYDQYQEDTIAIINQIKSSTGAERLKARFCLADKKVKYYAHALPIRPYQKKIAEFYRAQLSNAIGERLLIEQQLAEAGISVA